MHTHTHQTIIDITHQTSATKTSVNSAAQHRHPRGGGVGMKWACLDWAWFIMKIPDTCLFLTLTHLIVVLFLSLSIERSFNLLRSCVSTRLSSTVNTHRGAGGTIRSVNSSRLSRRTRYQRPFPPSCHCPVKQFFLIFQHYLLSKDFFFFFIV